MPVHSQKQRSPSGEAGYVWVEGRKGQHSSLNIKVGLVPSGQAARASSRMAELQGSKLAGQQAGQACRLQEEGLEQAKDTKTGSRPILQILNSMESLKPCLWLGAALEPLRSAPQLLGRLHLYLQGHCTFP